MAVTLAMNFCPRCAHELEDQVAYGRVRRVCPSCGFVFFREHKVAAAAVVENDGRLLFVRRGLTPGQGKWTIPGGFVDFDEDPRQAVVREVLEETGYRVAVVRLLDVIHGQEHERGASLLIAYHARLLDDAPIGEADKAEVTDVAFFPPDRLPPIAFRATKRAIEVWSSTS